MKTIALLVFPMAVLAQTEPCAKTSLLYSREIFRGPVTVERTMALSRQDNSCQREVLLPTTSWSNATVVSVPPYRFDPVCDVPQDVNGRDLFLGVVTDMLIKSIIYNQRR
ncbi:hypothetical protein FLLO111716_03845 [Flavobacterium longum]|uniref:hypothetical protein n=1 Tax=Flavobacterium longum TaxID=1299340 RepID=UPI0039E7932F